MCCNNCRFMNIGNFNLCEFILLDFRCGDPKIIENLDHFQAPITIKKKNLSQNKKLKKRKENLMVLK